MRDQYDAEFFGEFHEAFAETVDTGLAFVAGLLRRLRAPTTDEAPHAGTGLA
ncbi:MAG: hypothetical protein H7X93_11150 [Sphingomonadaceae bacterium]|nr:hypothetical protein [Sphingomonadaceae bacterium]